MHRDATPRPAVWVGLFVGLWLVVGCEPREAASREDATQTSAIIRTRPKARLAAGAASRSSSMAQTAFGTLWMGGQNDWGQRGSRNDFMPPQPTEVLGLTGGVLAMAVGGDHSLAVGADGVLRAWGNNCDGQLGNGAAFDALVPVPSLLY